jgi:DNA-binding FadR family transcriptional regulator
MKQITIAQVTSARVQIEKLVISNVIKYSDDYDIKLLRANILEAQTKASRGVHVFEDNIQFHRLLAKASKNPVFIVIMESIAAVLSHIRSLLGMDLELSAQACNEHEEILAAIENREEERAFQLIEYHLSHIEQMHKSFSTRHRKAKGKKVI